MLPQNSIELAKRIFKRNAKINYAFVFGSALKRLRKDSDIDFLIGGRLNFFERATLAAKLALGLKRNVDIVLTHQAPCELVMGALSHGLPVVINRKERIKEDYFRNYNILEQNRRLRGLRAERAKKGFGHGEQERNYKKIRANRSPS